MTALIFTIAAVLVVVGGVFVDPGTYYGMVRSAGTVVAAFVVARFLPSSIKSVVSKAPWSRADHLVMGITLSWMGNLLLALVVMPYRMFSDQDTPLELWQPFYRYLMPLSAGLALVGGFFHLSARSVKGKPNWWIRITIPLTIVIGIAAIVYDIRLNV